MKCKLLKLLFYHQYAWQEKAFNGAIMVVLSWIVLYFLLEHRYNYKRMVDLAKVIVGKNGKCIWITSLYIITILLPIIVCTLWCAYNNGIFGLTN